MRLETASDEGSRGILPSPRLKGQKGEYISFLEGTRRGERRSYQHHVVRASRSVDTTIRGHVEEDRVNSEVDWFVGISSGVASELVVVEEDGCWLRAARKGGVVTRRGRKASVLNFLVEEVPLSF